jgi:Na+/phosphate symporter
MKAGVKNTLESSRKKNRLFEFLFLGTSFYCLDMVEKNLKTRANIRIFSVIIQKIFNWAMLLALCASYHRNISLRQFMT